MAIDRLKIRLNTEWYNDGVFSWELEKQDPSTGIKGTPLEGLDAFQRQLYERGLKVSTENASPLSDFYEFPGDPFRALPSSSVPFVPYITGELPSQSNILLPEVLMRAFWKGVQKAPFFSKFAATAVKPQTAIAMVGTELIPCGALGQEIRQEYDQLKSLPVTILTALTMNSGYETALRFMQKAMVALCTEIPATSQFDQTVFDVGADTIIASPNTASQLNNISQRAGSIDIMISAAVPSSNIIFFDSTRAFLFVKKSRNPMRCDYNKIIKQDYENAAIWFEGGLYILNESAVARYIL